MDQRRIEIALLRRDVLLMQRRLRELEEQNERLQSRQDDHSAALCRLVLERAAQTCTDRDDTLEWNREV